MDALELVHAHMERYPTHIHWVNAIKKIIHMQMHKKILCTKYPQFVSSCTHVRDHVNLEQIHLREESQKIKNFQCAFVTSKLLIFRKS